MGETRFDQFSRRVGVDASRRQLLGGLIGAVVALLSGLTVLEAKPNRKNNKNKGQGRGRRNNGSRGKGRGRGKGSGRRTEKIQVCHRSNGEKGYTSITVGAPARGGHGRHGDVVCELEPCEVATGCDDDGACISEQAPEGARCKIDGDKGTCDADGTCVPDDEDNDEGDNQTDGDDDGDESER